MVYPKNGWLRMGMQGVFATWIAILAVGCASPEGPEGSLSGATVQTIDEVRVDRDGEDSVIRLDGLVDPIYSVTAREEQDLVIVDLVGVGRAAATSLMGAMSEGDRQVAAYDGVIDLVTMSTFDEDEDTPLTRLEVMMAGPGRAEVTSSIDGLEIRIVPGVASEVAEASADGSEAPSEESLGSDPWSSEATGSEVEIATEAAAEGPISAEAPGFPSSVDPPSAATRLTGIAVEQTGDGVLLGLEADGSIGRLEAFTLEDPARLVIDLPGLTGAELAPRTEVGDGRVKSVRIGSHADKVRVVVDGGAEAGGFQGRQIMPGTTGLWIAIGDGEPLAQAMNTALETSEAAWVASSTASRVASQPVAALGDAGASDEPSDEALMALSQGFEDEAQQPEATDAIASNEAELEQSAAPSLATATPTTERDPVEPMEASSEADLAEVYGLHYERTEGLDRIAILADSALAYETSAPDSETLVLRIPGASISEEASDRIFPKRGGPISLIHAFQQPEIEVPEVRVVFTRAPDLEPVVKRRGSMLFVEFQDMGVAAAPPPAFPGVADDEGAVASASGSDSASIALSAADSSPGSMSGSAAPTGAGGDSALPSFETGARVDDETSPAGDGGVWEEPATSAPAVPAAVEVPAAIEVLEEGGLIDGKEYRGRRVSLDFKDVAIADVLRLIAEVSDLNIIAGDEVKGNVTIRLVEVPWDQALDVILMTKGLGFVRVGNVLRIAPSDVLKAEEEVRLQERRNKEKLEDLEVKLLPVNYADVRDVEGLVKRLLSARGTVNLDQRTNTLIIKDISSVIDEASALIAAIDTQTPQVMIEAKIVEANLDFSRELGSVWGVQTQQFTDPFDPNTPRQDLGSEDLTFIDENSLAFANPITSVPTGLLTVGALILDQDFRVDAQIQAAESTGDGKVVSSPRIVTLDNREARIEQGVSIPFQTFEGGDARLEFIDAVLSLVVTPHITADGSIIMEIEVTRNAPDDSVSTPTGSPAIAKNVAQTETMVKDGQTLVLGGIYTIIKSNRQTRIPYLHRIPVIGNAFKSNEVSDSRKELLVFVTPRVVRLPEMASK